LRITETPGNRPRVKISGLLEKINQQRKGNISCRTSGAQALRIGAILFNRSVMNDFAPTFTFLPALIGGFLALLVGIGLGAFAGSATRPLVRGASLPIAGGVGVLVGLVATIGSIFLVVALPALRLPFLPIGWLAAGILFGAIVAVSTLDWAGVTLAGGLLTTFVTTTITSFFFLSTLLRLVPPFIWKLLPPFLVKIIFGAVAQSVFAMAGLAVLCLIGYIAAVTARVVSQFFTDNGDEGSTPTTSPFTPPSSSGSSSIPID
jgi:hypothetical protein